MLADLQGFSLQEISCTHYACNLVSWRFAELALRGLCRRKEIADIYGFETWVTACEPHAPATHFAWFVHRLALGLCCSLAHLATQLPSTSVRSFILARIRALNIALADYFLQVLVQ